MYDPVVPAADLVRLFDVLPDAVFFIKDRQGRYTHVNFTFAKRLGLHHATEAIGRHPTELFPEPLGASYARQDGRVLAGRTLDNHLEVHLFPSHSPGWCLTRKLPLRVGTEIVGLVGISRDLRCPDARDPVYPKLLRAVEHLTAHFAEPVRVTSVAQVAGISVTQLERQFLRVFQLNPEQMLTTLRIDAAMRLLGGGDSIASVGQACGYTDQSAFSRQFRKLTGLTPRQYRALRGPSADIGDASRHVSA